MALVGSCWTQMDVHDLAPAIEGALASRAICSGVTGTLCCFGSVEHAVQRAGDDALSLM